MKNSKIRAAINAIKLSEIFKPARAKAPVYHDDPAVDEYLAELNAKIDACDAEIAAKRAALAVQEERALQAHLRRLEAEEEYRRFAENPAADPRMQKWTEMKNDFLECLQRFSFADQQGV